MRRSVCLAVLGLLAHLGRCQFPPGLGLAGMGGLASGMGGSTIPEAMQEAMMMQALSGGASGSGGSGAGGSAGGMDPAMLMMLAQRGGASSMTEMLPMLMMMRNNQPDGNQAAGNPAAARGAGGAGLAQGAAAAGAGNNQNDQSFPASIANMLGNSGSGITPSQQASLFSMVQMAGGFQRIMDAVTSPTDRITLERDGMKIRPMAQMMMCPRPTNCQLQLCENTEIPFTPESFYTCRGCPRCRLDTSTRTMMNMMSQMGGTGGQGQTGGSDPLQQIMMMQALQGQGGQIPPALMMAMMSEQSAGSQAPQTNPNIQNPAQPQSLQMRLQEILPQLNRNQAQMRRAAQPAIPQLQAATPITQQLPSPQMTSQMVVPPQIQSQMTSQMTSQIQPQQLSPQQQAMLQQQLQIQQIQMQQMKRQLEQQNQILQQQQQASPSQQEQQTMENTQQPMQTQWTPPAGFPTSVPEPTAQAETETTLISAENQPAEGKGAQISKPIPRPPPEFIAAMRAMGEKMRAQRKAIDSSSATQAQQ